MIATLKYALAGAALAVAGTAASAATCQFGTAGDFPLTADVYTSTACEGMLEGNDSAGLLNSMSLFGVSDWYSGGKVEDGAGTGGMLTITTDGMMSGTWAVDSWDGIAQAVLVVKGGPAFAAYLLDITAGLTGAWTTNALLNPGGNQPDISHVSLYVAPIPLPATGLLLLAGIGGLAALRRRKTA